MNHSTWCPTPQKSQNAPDYVIEQIRNALLSHELNPGDKLPSETELSALFQVSRGSVRQAMKSLEILGILTIRPGDGTYINETVSQKSFNPLTFALLISRPSIEMIYEARYALERDIYELLMVNEENIAKLLPLLEENLQTHKQLLLEKADASVLAANDMEFHKLISKHCGNLILQIVYDYVMQTVESHLIETTMYQTDEKPNFTVRDHTSIIEALKNRNFNDAKQAAKITADSWSQLLKEHNSEFS